MTFTNHYSEDTSMLVLSLPQINSKDYHEVYDDVVDFHINYAKTVIGNDNVIVLADKKGCELLKDKLPQDIIYPVTMYDIWMRDFTTVLPTSPVQFRYTAAGQAGKQHVSDEVQKQFVSFTESLNLKYRLSSLKLDGGNVVDDQKDRLIVTRRFLKDNNLDVKEGKQQLEKITGFKQIAIIPEDGTHLAHVDAMLMFVNSDTIIFNNYGSKLNEEIIQELTASFSGIKLIKVDVDFDKEVWDPNFESACGINVNSVVTQKNIYMADFGTAKDEVFYSKLKEHTDKKILRVPAGKVCKLGGCVRCLTWQVRGENARKLIAATQKN